MTNTQIVYTVPEEQFEEESTSNVFLNTALKGTISAHKSGLPAFSLKRFLYLGRTGQQQSLIDSSGNIIVEKDLFLYLCTSTMVLKLFS